MDRSAERTSDNVALALAVPCLRSLLQALEEVLVVGVGADPEPDPAVLAANREGPVITCDPGRVDGAFGVDLLELKARVARIVGEELECFPRPLLDLSRKVGQSLPEGRGGLRPHSSSGTSSSVRPALSSRRA